MSPVDVGVTDDGNNPIEPADTFSAPEAGTTLTFTVPNPDAPLTSLEVVFENVKRVILVDPITGEQTVSG